MATEKRLQDLKINKLSKEKFDTIQPEKDQFYVVSNDDSYVETDQGVENAGKALVVGEDGKVTTGKSGTRVILRRW